MTQAEAPWRVQKQRIFVSYRRDDSQWAAGRLADSLAAYFGDDRVFRDIDGIAPGERFGDVIESTLGAADAVIVLIGRNWLDARDEQGRRRLDDPDDWVAQEVAAALDKGLAVYPVLIDDAPMPRVSELPESLQSLTRHNAVSISDDRWRTDVARLGRIISLDMPSTTERKLKWLNLAMSTLLFVAIAFTISIVVDNLLRQSASVEDFTLEELVNWKNADDARSWFSGLFSSAGASQPDGGGRCENPPNPAFAPIGTVQAGLVFLVMVPASALMFVFARHVDPARRHLFHAAAWTGAIGSLVAFVAFYPVCEEYEPWVISYLGMLFAPLMLVFMSLSGFKPK